MHPPPGQTGCPELGSARKGSGSRDKSGRHLRLLESHCSVSARRCIERSCSDVTSSLLLSRLDIETSSIFICQNYQMSRRCCGHAVAQQALAKAGLQCVWGGNAVSNTVAPSAIKTTWINTLSTLAAPLWSRYSQLHAEHSRGVTSHLYNLRITRNTVKLASTFHCNTL